VSDGRVLAYDAATGEGQVVGIAEDGTVTSEGVLDLGRDWLTFTVVSDGVVVLGDGTGELELVAVGVPGRVETLDELDLDRTWTQTTFTTSGLVVLYDTATGESQLVDATGDDLVAGTEATLPSGSIALTARV